MPDEVANNGFWLGVGAAISAAGAWFVKWSRTGRRDAMKEWQHLYDMATEKAEENSLKIESLTARVDECEVKHENCEKQHQECERNLSEVKHRLDSLESTVSQIKP